MYISKPRRGHRPRAGETTEEPDENPLADASDKEVLLALARRLGERRVLTDAYLEETKDLVLGSVRDIRGWLTEALTELSADSPAAPCLIRLRVATNRYLTFVENRKALDFRMWEPVRIALMKLRAEFKTVLIEICKKYTLQPACDFANSIERELQWGWDPETMNESGYIPPPKYGQIKSTLAESTSSAPTLGFNGQPVGLHCLPDVLAWA
jgi:hypothetical protein